MCGIAGLVNFEEREDLLKTINPMLRVMSHRGPDATGVYLSDEVGLGHGRLSIIDLSGGDQPIHNENRRVWLIFNGEIFNYPELRVDLIHKGHQFYTQSDTEVIVHLYEEHGTDMFGRLNGQFAIALWDSDRRRLLLARDRMGIRPLFYHHSGRRLHFASEIKALLTDPRIPRRLDRQTLGDVFTCWTPVDPMTAFEGLHQLPPAHFALFSADGLRIERYWQLDFANEADLRSRPLEAWAEETAALVQDAARIRLRADVPVGAYLSGGIDSTYISTLVRNHFDNRLNTFSVQFSDERFDESRFQQTALSAIRTEHRAIQCTEKDIGRLFPQVVWQAETTMLRTAPAPLMMLSRLVRDSGFKVVLTGEGADEVFAGYNIFKEAAIRRFWARHPESRLRPRLLQKLYPYVFSGDDRQAAFWVGFFKKGLLETDSPVYSHLVRWQNTSQLKSFFSPEVSSGQGDLAAFTRKIIDQLPPGFSQWTHLAQAQYLESTLFLSNYLLSTQGDRMAMANSIEGRYPFLDYRVVELGARMPARLRLNGLTEKFILKHIARRQVPAELVDRPKQPYRAPISSCFLGADPPDYVAQMLSESHLKQTGYFDPLKVGRLLAKCRQQEGRLLSERENMAIVGILSTQLLDYQFIRNFRVDSGDALDHSVVETQKALDSEQQPV